MNFTVSTVAKSLASYLAPHFQGVTFFESPNQQGSTPPCMFLQQRYAYIEHRLSGRYLRRIGLDLTYLVDYNLPNMQELYQQAAETLDILLDTFPYSDDTASEPTLIRTYNREWRIDLDAMHYKFELQTWVYLPEDFNPIQTMDYHQEVRDEAVQP
nr:MAG TPA: hypothetical protein [Caudoviricetes sp.]